VILSARHLHAGHFFVKIIYLPFFLPVVVDIKQTKLYPLFVMKPKGFRIIHDNQIDLKILRDLNITIIGYGSQGRAQALNLRDSGFSPVIGIKTKSGTRRIARKDGFKVTTPAKAVKDADVISIMIPDHLHQELFENELGRVIKKGQTYVFAHALSVHFNLVIQPNDVDFALVAPHGPGLRLREKFISGKGVPAFIAKTDISSKRALKIAGAYAKAIGCSRAGLLVTSFAEEAIGDIFGEQAVLCGGLAALLKSGFDALVKEGFPPQNAYIECVYQLDLIVDLIKKYGIGGMYERISTTAEYGSYLAEDKIINAGSKKAMQSMLKRIKSGKFTAELMDEYQRSFKKLHRYRNKKWPSKLDEMARYFNKAFNT
jgi:ketol-acid reductoisomerase